MHRYRTLLLVFVTFPLLVYSQRFTTNSKTTLLQTKKMTLHLPAGTRVFADSIQFPLPVFAIHKNEHKFYCSILTNKLSKDTYILPAKNILYSYQSENAPKADSSWRYYPLPVSSDSSRFTVYPNADLKRKRRWIQPGRQNYQALK